jgi:translation initiation factor 1 (eIF-1/SUI1)
MEMMYTKACVRARCSLMLLPSLTQFLTLSHTLSVYTYVYVRVCVCVCVCVCVRVRVYVCLRACISVWRVHVRASASRFIGSLSQYYMLTRDGKQDLRKGVLPPLQVLVEPRQGGRKHVTHVSGLEAFGIDPKEAKKAMSCFAASATVRPMESGPGAKKGHLEVQVQGDQSQAVTDLFTSKRYGLHTSHIQITVRGGRGGKKKQKRRK